MNITKQALTPTEIDRRIKRLEATIMTEFGVTPSEIKQLIINNKDLLHVDPSKLQSCTLLFTNNYGLKDYQVEELFFNCPLLFFDAEYISKREAYLKNRLGITPKQFGFILFNNPMAVYMHEQQLEAYINSYSKQAGLSDYFIKNILTKTTYFYNSPTFIKDMRTRIKLLGVFGLTYEQIASNPSICANPIPKLLTKIKIAKLNDLKMSDYIDLKYITSEQKIYARHKAKEFGIIDIPTIYIKESEFAELTDFTTEDLMKSFPLDDEAKKSLDSDFAIKFPELEYQIQEILRQAKEYPEHLEINNDTTKSQIQTSAATRVNTDDRKKKFEVAKAFGINIIPPYCTIFFNSLDSMLFKLKIAKLNDCSMERYIEGCFRNSEDKVYARYMGQLDGLTQLPTIYISEKDYCEQTGFSSKQMSEKYPLNEDARVFIDTKFAQELPDLAYDIEFTLKTTTKNEPTQAREPAVKENALEKQETQTEKTHNKLEPETPYMLKKFVRITKLSTEQLQQLSDKFKNKKITEDHLNAIALNFVTLQEYGFSNDEIVTNPSALLANHDKLVLRLKLAKIHNRTNKQFLSSDYKASEETVFVRTCGVKIMKLASSSLVYETEAKFTKSFGASTDELRRYCRLDQNGLDLIEDMYVKVQQNGDESEQ